jgi:hypothetical protein
MGRHGSYAPQFRSFAAPVAIAIICRSFIARRPFSRATDFGDIPDRQFLDCERQKLTLKTFFELPRQGVNAVYTDK